MYEVIKPTGRAPVMPFGLNRVIIGGHEFTLADFETWATEHEQRCKASLDELAKDVAELRAEPKDYVVEHLKNNSDWAMTFREICNDLEDEHVEDSVPSEEEIEAMAAEYAAAKNGGA